MTKHHKNESVRVFSEDKELIRKLKDKAKLHGGPLKEADIIKVALSLIKDDNLHKAVVQKRKGRDRKSILQATWFKENPKKTLDDFGDFTLTANWLHFVEKNKQLISRAI